MFCPKCRNEIKYGTQFCNKCGRQLDERDIAILNEEYADSNSAKYDRNVEPNYRDEINNNDYGFYLQQLSDLVRSNEELRRENDDLRRLISAQEINDDMNTKIEELVSENEQIKRRNKEYKKEIRCLKESNEELTGKLNEAVESLGKCSKIIMNVQGLVNDVDTSDYQNLTFKITETGKQFAEKLSGSISKTVSKITKQSYKSANRICPECKCEVREGADYCTKCGTKMPDNNIGESEEYIQDIYDEAIPEDMNR